MTHPTRENWMEYLYGEMAAETRAELDAHLDVCPECKASVDGWRTTLRHLDGWALPERRGVGLLAPLVKWGVAAAVVLGLGFGLGRFSSPATIDTGKIRAELLPELRQQMEQQFVADWRAALASDPAGVTNEFRRQLRASLPQAALNNLAASSAETQRLLADFVQSYNDTRAEDHRAMLALFQEADQQRRADFASLRKDLETVAVLTEGRLDSAQQEIGQLAVYAQADRASSDPANPMNPVKKSKGN